jgi:archaellum component FlaF (FlaF/FlaG flagellin family)
MTNTILKALTVKVEIELTAEKTSKIVITPREKDVESLKVLDALFHAILSKQPKRGAYLLGSNSFRVEVKTDDCIDSLEK